MNQASVESGQKAGTFTDTEFNKSSELGSAEAWTLSPSLGILITCERVAITVYFELGVTNLATLKLINTGLNNYFITNLKYWNLYEKSKIDRWRGRKLLNLPRLDIRF